VVVEAITSITIDMIDISAGGQPPGHAHCWSKKSLEFGSHTLLKKLQFSLRMNSRMQ
jgi:hypothetical protein